MIRIEDLHRLALELRNMMESSEENPIVAWAKRNNLDESAVRDTMWRYTMNLMDEIEQVDPAGPAALDEVQAAMLSSLLTVFILGYEAAQQYGSRRRVQGTGVSP